MPKGDAMTARMELRYAAYCESRDGGSHPADAGTAAGVGQATWRKYERAYRRARGLPEDTMEYRQARRHAADAAEGVWRS